ncbi:ScbR family autoregulator-binding transcription factor [Streptomyces sp. NPDC014685]|uniref:ScbR family autoregulator-binding transcription factor n=1 Tax=Streptomyces sp. NPDC014685 TaxID=3364881 RepID=UPI0036FCB6D5
MQARSQRTRQRLVRAGAEMFNRNGYANATLGQIAGAAGMTKGALYFHFASKDGLADAVQERGRDMLQDFIREHREAGVPPVQVLIDMTHWLARTFHDDPVIRASFRITNECTGRQPPVTDFHQAWITEVLRLLGQARVEGALQDREAVDGPETLLSATVCGIGVLAGTGMPYPQLGDRVAALWKPLLSALVPSGDAARYRTHPPATAGNPRPQAVAESPRAQISRTQVSQAPVSHADAHRPVAAAGAHTPVPATGAPAPVGGANGEPALPAGSPAGDRAA